MYVAEYSNCREKSTHAVTTSLLSRLPCNQQQIKSSGCTSKHLNSKSLPQMRQSRRRHSAGVFSGNRQSRRNEELSFLELAWRFKKKKKKNNSCLNSHEAFKNKIKQSTCHSCRACSLIRSHSYVITRSLKTSFQVSIKNRSRWNGQPTFQGNKQWHSF